MKKYLLLLVIVMQSVVSFGQTDIERLPKTENRITDLVIKNVGVITMKTNEVIKNQDVVIKDGKIITIAKTSKRNYKNSVVIDGSNKYIMPSLSDAHVHLPKDENDLEKVLTLNLINGVTKLRSMRGEWNHLEWRKKYNTAYSFYPKLYLSAPPVSSRYDFSSEQLSAFVKAAKGFDFIKILSIRNEAVFKDLDSLCKINNIKIGGHFLSNVSDDLLFKSNFAAFEHLGGLTADPELVESRLQAIKNNKIFICPTLSWYSVGSGRYTYDELRNQSGMEYVSKDEIDGWIEKTKAYRAKIGLEAYKEEVVNELKKLDDKYRVIKILNDLDVKMILSPDSSSKYMVAGFGVLDEMKLLKNADLSNYDILKMTTVNFASFFNESYGTIEEGKEADFILLNNNPLENLGTLKSIQGVFYNKNYLDDKALNKLSKAILAN
ncbi:amidohydrolase family protein [Lacinutrix mariniflava]|uniref:amidohydrolase family protein n=1 Tax=Lacinutrix mariniflava TaxID=342955 RepID=UPI0006E14C60|nr:amidohydrolase family protein [Lacinutrix mariniflava]